MTWPLQKQQGTGEPVRTVQYLLNAKGHSVAVDGNFGPSTEEAVRAFQTAQSLGVDGQVGAETWPALIVQVRQGDQGDAVKAVQSQAQFRNQSGEPDKGLKVDGEFGPKTDAWVRGIQSALGISSDGIVGPQTWEQLVSGALGG